MQETWAIQGVYPGHGVDAGFEVGRVLGRRDDPPGRTSRAKQVAEIPFHVKDTRKTAHAVRFPRRRADGR